MSLRAVFLMVLITVLAFGGSSCSQGVQPPEDSSGQVLTFILASEPGNIDPHISNEDETAIVLRQVYDTLVYREPRQQTIIPGLAIQWTLSPDNLMYTFFLRQNVRFHDNTLFNAQAVADNFDRIMNLKSRLGKAGVLFSKYYVGYEIVDEFTIRVKLSQPYAPFLDTLSQPYLGIVSPTAFRMYSPDRYQYHQVGTGPFVFIDYIPGKHIILQRNLNYKWGPSFYLSPASSAVTRMEFFFIPNAKQRVDMINAGHADIVTNLLPVDGRSLTINPEVRIIPTKIAGQPLQFFINTSRFPTDNISFRQALLYGANRNFILDTVFQRFSSIAWAPITSNMLYYNGGLEGAYSTDVGKAQSLLNAIGYQYSDNNKYLDLGGQEAAINIIILSGDLYPDIVKSLSEQWRLIGINVKVIAVPTLTSLTARLGTNDYNLVAFSTTATDPAFLNDFYAPSSAYNWSKFSDTQLGELLSQGGSQADSATRLAIYSQIQQQIMDQALILPIAEPIRLDAANKRVQQLEFDTLGIPIVNNVVISN